MKSRIGFWGWLLLAGWLAGLGAAPAAEFKSGKEIDLSGDFGDLVFLSGGKLAIGARVADDIFASGGELNYTGASADHVLTAGGEITFDGAQVKTIIAAGGHLILNNTQVSNDVVMAGGDIKISDNSTVASSAVIAGGRITIDGKVGGDVTIRAGEITINGEVSGNADLAAEEVHLGPRAVIGGNLKHRTADLVVAPGATIKGEITKVPYEDKLKKQAAKFMVIASAAAMVFLVVLGLTILVSAGVFAGLMQATDRAIRGKTLSTLGIGLLVCVGFPVLIAISMASIIGIPIGLILIAFMFGAMLLALACVAHATGMAVRSGFSRGSRAGLPGAGGRILYALLGLAILIVLGLVPFIGHVVWIVASILGVGAASRVLFGALARTQAEAA